VLLFILSVGSVQTINSEIPETKNDKVIIRDSNNTVFENGLLPLPEEDSIVIKPLPLPKDPSPIPEPMPHDKSDNDKEKQKIPSKQDKHKGK
jgi:hypothetical protein